MMGKINFDKAGDAKAIHSTRHTDPKKTDAKTAVGGEATISNDRMQFSSEASEVGKLVDQIKQLPDIRTEKVNDLRARIETGNYDPAGEDIAAAILKHETEETA